MSSSSDDSPINHHHHQQSPDSDSTLQSSSKSYALSGRIMLASIIILFIVVIFLLFLHLYARWFLLRRRNNRHNHHRHHRRNRSTRIVFYVDNNPSPPSTVGLDPSVIKSLPMFVFSAETDGKFDGKVDGKTAECAVCLSEFETGETGRVLPKCKHSFHTECIDMWFFNNSTCPLCRTTVEANVETTSFVKSGVPEPGSSGLNLSRGNMSVQTTTSFSDRMKRVSDVRIDVPNRNELVGELGMTSSPSHGFRSPGGRLLTRIINMSRRSPAVSPSSGGGGSGSGCVVVPVGAAAELDIESASQESNGVGSFR